MSAKPVLFLLPGLMCDEAVWAEQVQALAPHAELRVPVFRGFDSLRGMAEHILAQAPARFSVAGHSMGGRVALELMQLAADRIDRFALLDTGVHPVQPGEAEKRQVLLDLADREGLEAVADSWAPPMVHPDRRADLPLMTAIRAMILRNSVTDFKRQVKALLDRGDQSLYLPSIRQHVRLICGAQDTWSPVEQHEAMLALLPEARLEVVEDCGHMATMEKPAQLNRLLLDWFCEQ